MKIKKIVERFSILADISLNDASKWFNMCKESADEIRSQLREDINEDDYEDRLNAAAASLSFYKYVLYATSRNAPLSVTNGVTAVAAGITDRKNMVESAKLTWKNARASISHLLKDPCFAFQSVG